MSVTKHWVELDVRRSNKRLQKLLQRCWLKVLIRWEHTFGIYSVLYKVQNIRQLKERGGVIKKNLTVLKTYSGFMNAADLIISICVWSRMPINCRLTAHFQLSTISTHPPAMSKESLAPPTYVLPLNFFFISISSFIEFWLVLVHNQT